MLSFAIPGTVIGVAYILAFNVPPIEITGTALILIVCNVFRNMPVGVRAGMAAMSQIDKSLDEASTVLGARGFTTLRTHPAAAAEARHRRGARLQLRARGDHAVGGDLPRLRANTRWATTYIINRVVNGDYGVAIAYSSGADRADAGRDLGRSNGSVGERRLGRRAAGVRHAPHRRARRQRRLTARPGPA